MILLVGATGFLGPVVLKKLIKNNYKVRCLVRADSDRSKLKEAAGDFQSQLTFAAGDLTGNDSMDPALKDVSQAVYMIDLEHTGPVKNFLAAARKAGLKRVVFISSTTVLVPLKSKVKDKKLSSEKLIENTALDWTILRPTMIFGSEDDENF